MDDEHKEKVAEIIGKHCGWLMGVSTVENFGKAALSDAAEEIARYFAEREKEYQWQQQNEDDEWIEGQLDA